MSKIDAIFGILHPDNPKSYQLYEKDIKSLPEDEQYEAALAGIDLNNRGLRRKLETEIGKEALRPRFEMEEALQDGTVSRGERSHSRVTSGVDTYRETFSPRAQSMARAALGDAGISINMPPSNAPHYLKTMLGEAVSKKHPSGNKRYGYKNYFNERVRRERTLGIAASGKLTDPRPIYGALTIGQPWERFGAAPFYGGVALHLDPAKVADRVSVMPFDSFMNANNLHRALPWEERTLFEGAVTDDGVVELNDTTVAMYAEAQLHGGLRREDIVKATVASSIAPTWLKKIEKELEGRSIQYEILDGFEEAYGTLKPYEQPDGTYDTIYKKQ